MQKIVKKAKMKPKNQKKEKEEKMKNNKLKFNIDKLYNTMPHLFDKFPNSRNKIIPVLPRLLMNKDNWDLNLALNTELFVLKFKSLEKF